MAVRTMTVLVAALMLSNLVLVGLLFWEHSSPSILPLAEAQTIARGGKYLVATANFSSSRQCVYLIDETQDRMLVFFWDETKNRLRMLAYRNLDDQFKRAVQMVEERPGR